MHSSMTSLAVFGLGLLASTSAHMVITNPVPFDQSGLNNSPLAADGSDFPCKFGGATGYTSTVTSMNNLAVGETSNLTFMGSATHGGGSCQISITTDAVPTKNSIWKTIYSIEGGCPTNAAGNVGDDASYQGPLLNSFDFSLPKSIPSGKVTLAWTWLNKIGNREFYMNCAPLTVTGGASDTSDFDQLPNMEVYNIAVGGTTCVTPETFDMEYQNPGSSTTKVGSGPFTTASCKAEVAGSGAAATPAAGSSSAAGGTEASGVIGSSPAAATTTAASNPGGVFAPNAASSSTPAAAAPTTMATSAAAPAPAAASTPAQSAAPAAASGASSGSPASGQVACTATGFYCIDATHFGLCANGYATPMEVADGTACGNNAINYAVAPKPAGVNKREASKVARRIPPHARRQAATY